MTESQVDKKEPRPKPGKKEVRDFVLRELITLNQSRNSIWFSQLILNDFNARIQMGLKKHGSYLETFNGRDALMDALQENIDLCMYLGQAVMENGSTYQSETYSLFLRSIDVCMGIRHLMIEMEGEANE